MLKGKRDEVREKQDEDLYSQLNTIAISLPWSYRTTHSYHMSSLSLCLPHSALSPVNSLTTIPYFSKRLVKLPTISATRAYTDMHEYRSSLTDVLNTCVCLHALVAILNRCSGGRASSTHVQVVPLSSSPRIILTFIGATYTILNAALSKVPSARLHTHT